MTMTTSEFEKYNQSLKPNGPPVDARLGLKDSLFSIFVRFAGLQNHPESTVFCLQNESAGGVNILIFGSTLRMDMANPSVFLDAAVVPLHDDMMADALPAITKIHNRGGSVVVKVDDAELSLWKHVLPAFAERCRNWKHNSFCEYLARREIPLTTEYGKRFMCSCGFGVFPKAYLSNLKEMKQLRKFAIRVAIPVFYSSPPQSATTSLAWPRLLCQHPLVWEARACQLPRRKLARHAMQRLLPRESRTSMQRRACASNAAQARRRMEKSS
jgi:hypothetical protein